MAQQFYIAGIPSLHQTFPQLPAAFGNIDFNISIQVGEPLNPEHRRNAKAVTEFVKAAHSHGIHEAITSEIVEAAELRQFAVDSAHSMATYMPDIAQALGKLNNQLADGFNLVNQRMDQLDQRMDQLSASTQNIRIVNCNRNRLVTETDLEPLLKTRPGHGLALAFGIFGDALDLQIPEEHQLQIGAAPPGFQAYLFDYHEIDIANLIIFYNETFKIVQGDALGVCINKFQGFLHSY